MSIQLQEVGAGTLAPHRLGEIPAPDKHLEPLLYEILAQLLLKYQPVLASLPRDLGATIALPTTLTRPSSV